MEDKVSVILDGKVVGKTELKAIDVNHGTFFTQNGGEYFEARAEYSHWLDYVVTNPRSIGINDVDRILEQAAKDWNSTWYKMKQNIPTNPKLTITIHDINYSLRLEEVINGKLRSIESVSYTHLTLPTIYSV